MKYQISTDQKKLDIAMINAFLAESYWAAGIPRQVVARSIRNSLCFGVFHKGKQIGFARTITDRATFAYLADVFVVPAHRGCGVGKLIVAKILAHPELQGLRRLMLATWDAHGLYAQFGFKPLPDPERFMTIAHGNIYQKTKARPKAAAKKASASKRR